MELIVDYRKRWAEQAPINMYGAVVERVESFKFIGVHITNKLLWSKNTKTVVKRARQHLSHITSKSFTAAQLRASSLVASPPGMATARHLIVRHYRG